VRKVYKDQVSLTIKSHNLEKNEVDSMKRGINKSVFLSLFIIAILAGSVFAAVTITDTSTGKSVSGRSLWEALQSFFRGGATGSAVGGQTFDDAFRWHGNHGGSSWLAGMTWIVSGTLILIGDGFDIRDIFWSSFVWTGDTISDANGILLVTVFDPFIGQPTLSPSPDGFGVSPDGIYVAIYDTSPATVSVFYDGVTYETDIDYSLTSARAITEQSTSSTFLRTEGNANDITMDEPTAIYETFKDPTPYNDPNTFVVHDDMGLTALASFPNPHFPDDTGTEPGPLSTNFAQFTTAQRAFNPGLAANCGDAPTTPFITCEAFAIPIMFTEVIEAQNEMVTEFKLKSNGNFMGKAAGTASFSQPITVASGGTATITLESEFLAGGSRTVSVDLVTDGSGGYFLQDPVTVGDIDVTDVTILNLGSNTYEFNFMAQNFVQQGDPGCGASNGLSGYRFNFFTLFPSTKIYGFVGGVQTDCVPPNNPKMEKEK